MDALRVHFPTDLAKLILQISNHSEHNDKLELCLGSIQAKIFSQNYLRFSDKLRETGMERCDKIKREYPDIQQALTILSKCSCCIIHNSYKPKSFQFLDACEYRICCSPPKSKTKKSCDCSCRHVARSLIRAHTYTDIEHIEDNRHLLHIEYLNCKENQQTQHKKLRIATDKKLKYKNKIASSNASDATYMKYYSLVDEVLELQTQEEFYKIKIEELLFELHMHIHDYPDVFTNIDSMFKKLQTFK